MVIKYFLLITIIYKSIEITFDENCGENKYYNYFLFECRDIDSSNYRISILTKNIICKQCGKEFEVNKHYSGNYICNKCQIDNKEKIKQEKINQKESLKIEILNTKLQKKVIKYISEETVKYNKNFPNIQDNKNNNNLRKLASNEYFYFLEDENKYKNSDKLSTSDLFDKTSNSQKLMNLCVLKTIYDSTDLTEECKGQNSYNLTENQLFEELMTSSFS